MKYYPFLVDERPRCYWGPDIDDQERSFLGGMDGDYFLFLGEQYAAQLKTEHGQRAATALRACYHHATETFFALVGATIQAPRLTVAWIHEYRTTELRNVIRAVQNEDSSLRHAWKGVRPVSWSVFASQTIPLPTESPGYDVRAHFTKFWRRLAKEFLDDKHVAEYNSLKHGFRVRPGAASIQFGPERVPGRPAEQKDMHTLEGGAYGSSFFTRAHPDGLSGHSNPNRRLIHQSLNWNAESLVERLVLISLSLDNLVSFLKAKKGITDASDFKLMLPTSEADFETCWNNEPNLLNMSFKQTVSKDNIGPMTEQEILDLFEDDQTRS